MGIGPHPQGVERPRHPHVQIDPARRLGGRGGRLRRLDGLDSPGRLAPHGGRGRALAGPLQQALETHGRLRAAILRRTVQIEFEGPGRGQPAQGQVAIGREQGVAMRHLQLIQRQRGRVRVQRQGRGNRQQLHR
ncbi:hypothetical protein [Castellaniella caeni]